MECSAVSVTVPVVTEGLVLGSVPAIVAEPGPRKANEGEEDEKENEERISRNRFCEGCWETLPDVCGCGVLRLCACCADSGLRGSAAEAGYCNAEGESAGEKGIAEALREEIGNMTRNFERVGGMIDDVGGLAREMADLRANMVSREIWQRWCHGCVVWKGTCSLKVRGWRAERMRMISGHDGTLIMRRACQRTMGKTTMMRKSRELIFKKNICMFHVVACFVLVGPHGVAGHGSLPMCWGNRKL